MQTLEYVELDHLSYRIVFGGGGCWSPKLTFSQQGPQSPCVELAYLSGSRGC